MDSLYSAPDSDPPDQPWRRRLRAFAVTLAAGTLAFLVLPAGAASADPDSVDEAKEKVERLTNKVEVVTEQYNGLRIRIEKVRKAAQAARETVEDKRRKLTKLREEATQLAATTYKTGGLNSAVVLTASKNPQQFLDRAATLRRMAVQNANKLRQLRTTVKTASKAEKAVQKRKQKVEELASEIEEKKQKIEGMLDEAEGELSQLTARANRASGAGSVNVDVSGSGLAAKATQIALNQQGDPYVWGAAGPNAFDCSGLVMYAYGQVGISLPHYTGAQYAAGTPVSRSNLQTGDLVFFYSDRHHVGIYIGNGKMVHAPNSTTVVKISPVSGRPYNGAVRVA